MRCIETNSRCLEGKFLSNRPHFPCGMLSYNLKHVQTSCELQVLRELQSNVIVKRFSDQT